MNTSVIYFKPNFEILKSFVKLLQLRLEIL